MMRICDARTVATGTGICTANASTGGDGRFISCTSQIVIGIWKQIAANSKTTHGWFNFIKSGECADGVFSSCIQ